jgi:hypothetical protein
MEHRCMSYRADRTQCPHVGHRLMMEDHLVLCWFHTRLYRRRADQAGSHLPGVCFHFFNGSDVHDRPAAWCRGHVEQGELYCVAHRHTHRPDPAPPVHRFIPPPRAGIPPIPDHIFFVEPPEIERRHLGTIARDEQNVHTREVSTQTNDAIQRLLAIPIDPAQQSRATLFRAWNLLPGPTREEKIRVATDVDRHFQLMHCRTQPPQPPDMLYRKMVRALVAYIVQVQNEEVKTNLWRRMYEECRESLEMCIDGHISRLANVLVGFDENFKSPVPQGELIQNRISAIAAMNIQPEEKTRLAIEFFEEISLPADHRTAWLEALAE